MIDKSKTYRTRDGREVRIYETDGGGEYPVHGAILAGGRWMISKWQQDGAWNFPQSDHDLIEVRPRHKRTIWVNVYPDEVFTHHHQCVPSRKGRIACVKVELDFEEGEGL